MVGKSKKLEWCRVVPHANLFSRPRKLASDTLFFRQITPTPWPKNKHLRSPYAAAATVGGEALEKSPTR